MGARLRITTFLLICCIAVLPAVTEAVEVKMTLWNQGSMSLTEAGLKMFQEELMSLPESERKDLLSLAKSAGFDMGQEIMIAADRKLKERSEEVAELARKKWRVKNSDFVRRVLVAAVSSLAGLTLGSFGALALSTWKVTRGFLIAEVAAVSAPTTQVAIQQQLVTPAPNPQAKNLRQRPLRN
uniref:Uncharacterized protein n=1 Tax=Kalanchoe fedtschenkoi TaxID=63787 RepID=A0A7N0RIM8_KALFE